MDKSINILLAEDDSNLAFVIKDNLEMNGYNVTHSLDGQDALDTYPRHKFHLCLLDVMLPRLDGFELANKIREMSAEVPILFLTARSMTEDRLEGFRQGGDDYITKPFSMEELLMRINVFLRRSSAKGQEVDSYQLSDYYFDYTSLKLTSLNSERSLTLKEAKILRLFCEHQNEVLKREFILKEVWGEDDYFLGRSLDVFISKLRKYLKSDPNIEITNYHGIGFRFSTTKTS